MGKKITNIRKFIGNGRDRLKEKAGESLIETLTSLLIICMGLAVLPGAIISAAKVNTTVEESYLYMETGEDTTEKDMNLKLYLEREDGERSDINESDIDGRVDMYKNKPKYYYYRAK